MLRPPMLDQVSGRADQIARRPPRRRATREESGNTAMWIAASKPSPIMSTIAPLKWRSIETSGYEARNSGNRGARRNTPKDVGAASRTRPRGAADCASASSSAASPSARMCAAYDPPGYLALAAGHRARTVAGSSLAASGPNRASCRMKPGTIDATAAAKDSAGTPSGRRISLASPP